MLDEDASSLRFETSRWKWLLWCRELWIQDRRSPHRVPTRHWPAALESPVPAGQSPARRFLLLPAPSAQFPHPRPTPLAPAARIPSSSATPPNPPDRKSVV